jgi:hypothetical protein
MTKKENRLKLIAPELSARLEQATSPQLRAVALAACRFALEHTSLADPTIKEALEALKNARYGDSGLREKLRLFVNSLDQKQWDLQDLMDEGKADQTSYLAAFQRARAANSLYCALDADDFSSATEAIYEANAATNDYTNLVARVLSILDR